MCENPQTNSVLNLSPEPTTLKKWQSPEFATPKHTKILDSVSFGGGKFGNLQFLGVAKIQDSVIFLDSGSQGNWGLARRMKKHVYFRLNLSFCNYLVNFYFNRIV